MFGWYGDLTPMQRRTFWACWAGWGLDAMDFQLYFFVIPTLMALWHITNVEAGFIATGTILASALGGWVAGVLGDRYGRARILLVTVTWYAVATFLCGFAQSPLQLGILRALVGIGFGGEWAIGAILVGEIVRASERGRAVGTVQSAYGAGWAAAALAYGACFSVFNAEIAWRVLFWIGLLPVVPLIFLRRAVQNESTIFERVAKQTSNKGIGWRIIAIFSGGLGVRTLLASLLCLGIQGGFGSLVLWLPTYLKNTRGLSVVGTTGFSFVVTVGSFFGFLAGAWLVDRIGRRKNFMMWSVFCSVTAILYLLLPLDNLSLMILGFPLGFVVSGIYGGIGAWLTELFPTRIRGTAQSFTYNVGRAFTAAVPVAIGYLSQVVPLGQAIAMFAVTCYVLVFIMALLLPETRGLDLLEADREAVHSFTSSGQPTTAQ